MEIAKQQINKLKPGDRIDLGVYCLSEQEIIDFAMQFDPLDFHVNREAAEKSYFKGIIASGPHIFTLIHRKEWIPRFGHTVIAGIEINHWKFLKPIYPDTPVGCVVTVLDIKPNTIKAITAIQWKYEFTDRNAEIVQSLEMLVLHKI